MAVPYKAFYTGYVCRRYIHAMLAFELKTYRAQVGSVTHYAIASAPCTARKYRSVKYLAIITKYGTTSKMRSQFFYAILAARKY